MSFDGTSGVVSVGRAEKRRAELTSLGDSAVGRALRVAFMGTVEGEFQIPAFIATPRVSTPSAVQASYVHPMFCFLCTIADDLLVPPETLKVVDQSLKHTSEGLSAPHFALYLGILDR